MDLSSYIVNYAKTKIPSVYGPLDKQGIPMFRLESYGSSGELIYHPIVIIQYGLGHCTLWLDGDKSAKKPFLNCVNWLLDNAAWEPKKRFLAWYYPFSMVMPPASAPWISGMAQGQALSLLVRAYQLTQSKRIEEVAKNAALSFLYELEDGGILTQTREGGYFVEECASSPPIHILNGCLYSLVGLYEYSSIFPMEQLRDVLTRCVLGVESLLPYFDLGWWSRYSLGLRWNLASYHYHHVHVKLLSYLADLLGSDLFQGYACQWACYEKSWVNRTRRFCLGLVQNNWNRVLRVMRLHHIRYRDFEAFGESAL